MLGADGHTRPYRDKDWAAVREIYDLSKPDELRGVVEASAIPPLGSDPEMLALFRDSQIVVMEDANRVVGFCGNSGTVITWLFVHPEYRRERVARALVRGMLARLDGTMTLNVATTNVAALNLHKHVGFTVERQFVGYFHGHSCPTAKLRYDKAD